MDFALIRYFSESAMLYYLRVIIASECPCGSTQ